MNRKDKMDNLIAKLEKAEKDGDQAEADAIYAQILADMNGNW